MSSRSRAAKGQSKSARSKRRRVDDVTDEIVPTAGLEKVAALEKSALSSSTKVNAIVELLELCDDADNRENETRLNAIYALHAVFLAYRGYEKPKPSSGETEPTGVEAAKARYRTWIHEQYRDYVSVLLNIISRNEPELLAVPCLNICMDLLANSAAVPASRWKFPNSLFERILGAIVGGESEKSELLEYFLEGYIRFDDIRRFTCKILAAKCSAASEGASASSQRQLADNVYHILQSFEGCRGPEAGGKPSLFVAPSTGELEDSHVLGKLKTYTRAYSQCWLAFLKLQLPLDIFKNVLLRICDDVMPYLIDPRLLIDFLRDSYDVGGVVSILALEGVFTLMQEHNLDYPLFYGKLYALFDPSIFHVKYRARFFRLADKFLKSTYLPGYLVAAFAKKLARLTLTAPPAGCMVSVRFIYNLLKRHPSCKVLIHRDWDDTAPAIRTDPYDPSEPDPANCRAMDSSLWEIQALLHHYYPDVAKLPSVMSTPALRKGEMDMRRAAQRTYSSLYTTERDWVYMPEELDEDSDSLDRLPRKLAEQAEKAVSAKTPLAFVRPAKLLVGTTFQHWAVE